MRLSRVLWAAALSALVTGAAGQVLTEPEAPAPPELAAPNQQAPWPLPAFTVTCRAPLGQSLTLHLAAADIAAGKNSFAALTARGYEPGRYRYWNLGAAGVSAALAQACAQGFSDYGLAPQGRAWVLLAARPLETPAPTSAAPSPANAAPAPASPAVPSLAAPLPSPVAPSAPAPAPASPAAQPGRAPVILARLPELLTALNEVRRGGRRCAGEWQPPAPPLTFEPRLALAAQLHANAMTLYGFFASTNPQNGSTPQRRAAAEGWTSPVSENLQQGRAGVQETLGDWLESSVNCINLMNPRWTHVGAGLAEGSAKAPGGPFWVLLLGEGKR